MISWRDRYETGGIAALDDAPRRGRPHEIDEIEVVAATLVNDGRPPQRLGVTHWSARFLAGELGISFATVARIWRKWGIEIFFGIITRQAIRRGTFQSVKELTAAIGAFIDAYNHRSQPFAWTKDADQLIAKIRPSKN